MLFRSFDFSHFAKMTDAEIAAVGKMVNEKIKENVQAFVKALVSSKPASSKGKFVKKITLSSTMGIGMSVRVEELVK